MEQKIEILEAVGLDVLIVEPFDLAFARTPPEEFVRDHVHSRIAPVEVYVGYDFHFGRDREGSMRLLTETGPLLGFSVTIIPEVTVGGRDVNSTRIRELLRAGEVEEAAHLLGRAFSVRGPVVGGMKRGRQLGFPTANLAPANEIMPGPGVYVCELRLIDDGPEAGRLLPAVTNVGRRPTFEDAGELVAEAHVIDFDGDLYGREVELSFLAQLRAEQKFDGPDALRAQIARDVEAARAWLAHPPEGALRGAPGRAAS
jgi:riboflavin kinase/FMN adenylyltransferase